MIEASLSNPTLIVAVTVALGFVFLLGTLLVPSEPLALSPRVRLPDFEPPFTAPEELDEESFTPPPVSAQFLRTAYVESEKVETPPLPTHRPIITESVPAPPRAVRNPEPPVQVPPPAPVPRPEPRREREVERQEVAAAPVPNQRRLTWTSLVDESAEELDLPTRLKIIEALGLVGGSWSREILARAYEQEMDATVRGAIFLALRDSKSAA